MAHLSHPLRLDTLPAEIRNHIMSFTLESGKDLHISRRFLHIPAMVKINRQLRKEAQAYWYKSNKFYATITDCNADDLVAFTKIMAPLLYVGEIHLDVKVVGRPDWLSLVKWCKAYFDKCHGWGFQWADDQGSLHAVVSGAFGVVNVALAEDLRWETCEEMLDCIRVVAGSYEDQWKED